MKLQGIDLILLNGTTITISRNDDGIINDEIGIFWKKKRKKKILDRNWIGILILGIMSFRKLEEYRSGLGKSWLTNASRKRRLDLPRILSVNYTISKRMWTLNNDGNSNSNVRYSPLFLPSVPEGKGNDGKILKSRDNKVLWGLAYILNLRGSLPLSLTPGINFRSKFFSK